MSVLVCWGSRHWRGLAQQTFSSHRSGGRKSRIRAPAWPGSCLGSPPGLLCAHMAEINTVKLSAVSSYKGANPPTRTTPSRSPLNPVTSKCHRTGEEGLQQRSLGRHISVCSSILPTLSMPCHSFVCRVVHTSVG